MIVDIRKPRQFKPRSVSVLIIDANTFNRNLLAEILRNLNITNLSAARDLDVAQAYLCERAYDVILLNWDPDDPLDGLAFLKRLRRVPDDQLRRVPVVMVTTGLTRQTVIDGRDAGIDEFLARPLAPAAVRQRLEMVIQTPRPFVDCAAYVGPCRRRKNPADYHGAKRRAGERASDRPKKMTDAEEEAAKSPIRVALSALRVAANDIRASAPETIKLAVDEIAKAKAIATDQKDHALNRALAAFEAYIMVTGPVRQLDPPVLSVALSALEQLAMLPMTYVETRDSVAIALGKAIQKCLAA